MILLLFHAFNDMLLFNKININSVSSLPVLCIIKLTKGTTKYKHGKYKKNFIKLEKT